MLENNSLKGTKNMTIENVKETINRTHPWKVLEQYIFSVTSGVTPENEYFIRTVECGKFYLAMRRGYLAWQFFMPSTYEVISAVPHNLSIFWECEGYIKEISFRREDLTNTETFFINLEKEMPKEMFSQFSKDLVEEDE